MFANKVFQRCSEISCFPGGKLCMQVFDEFFNYGLLLVGERSYQIEKVLPLHTR